MSMIGCATFKCPADLVILEAEAVSAFIMQIAKFTL